MKHLPDEYVTLFLVAVCSGFPKSYLRIFCFYMRERNISFSSTENHFLVEHFSRVVKFRSTVLWVYFNQLSLLYYQCEKAIRRFWDCFYRV